MSNLILGWAAGVLSCSLVLVLRWWLDELRVRAVERRERRKDERTRRIELDRQTHQRRITVLIRCYLAAYVRSGKWWNTRQDLERLLANLEQGGYEHFVDVEADAAWVKLVETTVRMARRRRGGTIAFDDISAYNQVRRAWETAADKAFGPLPKSVDLSGRHAADHAGSGERADEPEEYLERAA